MTYDWQYLRRKPAREITFRHSPSNAPLDLSDQSAGTLSWAQLLLAALSALEEGEALVVDEVDASLHPRLTARLFELFRHEATNTHGAHAPGLDEALVRAERLEPTGRDHTRNPSTSVWRLIRGIREQQ
jgi:predicted ATPase